VRIRASSLRERTLATIASFYDAALDETRWAQALENLSRLTGSQAASFWVLDAASESSLLTFVSINFDKRTIEEYLGGMAQVDPTVRHLLAHPNHSIVHDGMLGVCRDEQSRRYLDWHERTVETRYRLVGQTRLSAQLQAGVALHRSRRVGLFDARDIERFSMVHAHLNRALAIGARIGSLGTLRQLDEELLERSAAAVLLLDARGRVVYLNRTAEALQAQGEGLRIAADGVHFASVRDSAQLQCLIADALASLRGPRFGAAGVMRAARPSGRPAYGVWVAAMPRPSFALTLMRAAVCVVISDPDRRKAPPARHLQSLFSLTRAEATLAMRLAAGESLRSAAQGLGITYGTARTRLTQLFQKTRSHSQSELMHLLLSAIAWS